jgi:hypothetical protein
MSQEPDIENQRPPKKVPSPSLVLYAITLLRKSAKTFLYSYGLKAALNLVFALLAPKQRNALLRSLRPWLGILGSDALRFGGFVTLLSASYISIRTALAKFNLVALDSPASPLLAGIVSGAAIALDASSERRHELALYVLARAAHASWLYGQHQNVIPVIPHGSTISFSFLCAIIMYAFLYRPDALKRSYGEFIGRLASQARFSNLLYVLRELHGVPHVTRHYYKNKAAYDAAFIQDPRFLKTNIISYLRSFIPI